MARKKKLKLKKVVGLCPSCNKISLFNKKEKKYKHEEENDKFICVTCNLEFFYS
jgi:hypothetical protein